MIVKRATQIVIKSRPRVIIRAWETERVGEGAGWVGASEKPLADQQGASCMQVTPLHDEDFLRVVWQAVNLPFDERADSRQFMRKAPGETRQLSERNFCDINISPPLIIRLCHSFGDALMSPRREGLGIPLEDREATGGDVSAVPRVDMYRIGFKILRQTFGWWLTWYTS